MVDLCQGPAVSYKSVMIHADEVCVSSKWQERVLDDGATLVTEAGNGINSMAASSTSTDATNELAGLGDPVDHSAYLVPDDGTKGGLPLRPEGEFSSDDVLPHVDVLEIRLKI